MVPNFLLIARFTSSASSFARYNTTHFQLGSHSLNALLFSRKFFTSDRNHHKGDTFTVSYLIDSCGLSPTLARELSNRVKLKTPDGPNAVLDLLHNYGFSETQVARLVEKRPVVLVTKAQRTLLPKLKFLRSIGFSNIDIPKILLRNHVILGSSLENRLIPHYEILRGIVQDDHNVVRALRNAPANFSSSYLKLKMDLTLNIEVLRQSGVPQSSITFLMIHYPTAAYAKHFKFLEAVETIKEIGIDPLKTNFVVGVQVLSTMRKIVWKSRLELYERWGWNREMFLKAFRMYSNFVKLSDKLFTKKMSFLVKDMGLSPENIADFPVVLTYSLEKRMIPRFSVIKILKSKGLLRNSAHFTFMTQDEETFLEKYVVNFKKHLPLLADVYKGLIDYENLM